MVVLSILSRIFSHPRFSQHLGILQEYFIPCALMLQMNAPELFWANAVLTTTYLLNWMPFRILKGKSPFEMLFPGKNPFSITPKVFVCVSFVHNHIPNCDKLDHRFLDYSRTHKGYRYYNPPLCKHSISADVTFFKDVPYYSPKGG